MKGGLRGAVAFAAALVVLLTACAGSSKVQTLVPGVLRVGSSLDFKPFEYFQAQPGRAKVLKGFDVELVQDMANRLDLYVRWVDSDFATIFNSLASNNLDMVAATTITPTREQTVNFSNPYFLANQSLTVNVGKTPDITSTDNLGAGDIVAVQNGSTGASWAQENLVPQGVQLKRFNLTTDMFTELDAGTVTGVIDDEPAWFRSSTRGSITGSPSRRATVIF